jgi:phosphopentomutase
MTKQKVDDDQKLTRLIEEFIDKGADTAEEINRAVLDLPVTVLDSLGLEDTANEVKKVQDSSIGAVYNLIHEINHKVADLATDLPEQRRGNDILLVEMQ